MTIKTVIKRVRAWLMLLGVSVWLSGCTTPGGIRTGDVPDSTGEMTEEQSIPLKTGVAAADRLLTEGEAYLEAGDVAAAANAFERGLRMAPRSPALYLGLAKTRMQQSNFFEAQQMAQRAISLLPSRAEGAERAVQQSAWWVVAEARENLGDMEGAEAAREKAAY